MNLKVKLFLRIFAGVLLFAAGIFLGIYFANIQNNNNVSRQNLSTAVRAGENKYTNPLLECDQSQAVFTELKPFKNKINDTIINLKQNNNITDISLYFRDLNNGPWFGIGEDASFAPASLLKVPLAIAYYKHAESNPGFIQKTVTYKGPDPSWPNVQQTILPKQTLTVGQTYSMEELVKRMLAYSDNQSYYLLFTNIQMDDLVKVYDDFGLNINGSSETDGSIVTVKNYSSFFRMLFNASYLNQADSEKVLSFLAETDFQDGLVGGVPEQTAVAHKFGERELGDSQLDQIHDCGIVYYPQHPYLLCVMTKGTNIQDEENAIKQLSSAVYTQVNAQNKDSSEAAPKN